jgi:hypothetical protein
MIKKIIIEKDVDAKKLSDSVDHQKDFFVRMAKINPLLIHNVSGWSL